MSANQSPDVMAILGWVVAAVVLLGAMGLALIVFVVPKAAQDEFLAAHGLQEGAPERHIIPVGHTGWAVVKYDIPGAPELPMEDGVLVFRYPASGPLETASPFIPGIKRKEYFCDGPAGLEPLQKLGPNRRIWGAYDLQRVLGEDDAVIGRDRQSGFFAGTGDEYSAAKLRAQHLPPGMTLGDVPQDAR